MYGLCELLEEMPLVLLMETLEETVRQLEKDVARKDVMLTYYKDLSKKFSALLTQLVL